MSAESQRACGTCGHPKSHHRLPRVEGGYGGGDDGGCVVYACPCDRFIPSAEIVEQVYSGAADLPRWVKDGARVKVKQTDTTRRYGFRTTGGSGGDSCAWPGEVGTIERVDGAGWWDWRIQFDRGRVASLDDRTLPELLPVRSGVKKERA